MKEETIKNIIGSLKHEWPSYLLMFSIILLAFIFGVIYGHGYALNVCEEYIFDNYENPYKDFYFPGWEENVNEQGQSSGKIYPEYEPSGSG